MSIPETKQPRKGTTGWLYARIKELETQNTSVKALYEELAQSSSALAQQANTWRDAHQDELRLVKQGRDKALAENERLEKEVGRLNSVVKQWKDRFDEKARELAQMEHTLNHQYRTTKDLEERLNTDSHQVGALQFKLAICIFASLCMGAYITLHILGVVR